MASTKLGIRPAFTPRSTGEGDDGRDVIQMRVDLGILQMETNGRPDGNQPGGFATFLDSMLDLEKQNPDFVMERATVLLGGQRVCSVLSSTISWLRLEHYHEP